MVGWGRGQFPGGGNSITTKGVLYGAHIMHPGPPRHLACITSSSPHNHPIMGTLGALVFQRGKLKFKNLPKVTEIEIGGVSTRTLVAWLYHSRM